MSLLFWLATAATNWPHWATLTVVCMNVMRTAKGVSLLVFHSLSGPDRDYAHLGKYE